MSFDFEISDCYLRHFVGFNLIIFLLIHFIFYISDDTHSFTRLPLFAYSANHFHRRSLIAFKVSNLVHFWDTVYQLDATTPLQWVEQLTCWYMSKVAQSSCVHIIRVLDLWTWMNDQWFPRADKWRPVMDQLPRHVRCVCQIVNMFASCKLTASVNPHTTPQIQCIIQRQPYRLLVDRSWTSKNQIRLKISKTNKIT